VENGIVSQFYWTALLERLIAFATEMMMDVDMLVVIVFREYNFNPAAIISPLSCRTHQVLHQEYIA